jgi:hypothetical protein
MLAAALLIVVVAAAWLASKQARDAPSAPPDATVTPFAGTARSFTASFGGGSINNGRDVATPTRRGAFVIAWPGPSGPVQSLTVLASFRYRYPPVHVERGMALAFFAARPYPAGTPTRAFVTATDGGRAVVIYDEVLPPAGAAIGWHRHVVDLSRFAGRDVAFSFGADASRGDETAAWAAFGYPTLIAGPR